MTDDAPREWWKAATARDDLFDAVDESKER
jgi:hypothetical protein